MVKVGTLRGKSDLRGVLVERGIASKLVEY
jgi:hypothetical protein